MSRPFSMRSLSSFLPPRADGADNARDVVRGLQLLREATEDLPIQTPQDKWETSRAGADTVISRTMQLDPQSMKMLICDLIDAQETLGHKFTMQIAGDMVTVTSTTREYGEPTERDREVARYVDTSYDEIVRAYK